LILLMEEILHQLICSLSMYVYLMITDITGFYTSQVVVWDFSHQQ